VGSRAVKHYISDYRKPRDWDVICTAKEFQIFRELNPEFEKFLLFRHAKKWILRKPRLQVEFELAIPGSSGEILLSMVASKNYNFNLDACPLDEFPVKFKGNVFFAVPEILFLIKKSHVGYQIHWDKNIADYSFLKDHSGNIDFYSLIFEDFMSVRAAEMKERFSKRKKVNLDKDNSDFFKATENSVKNNYSHDVLYALTCYNDVPIYQKLKRDQTKAHVEAGLWNTLSYEKKVKAVREAAFVIALERKIIPAKEKGETWDRFVDFHWALMRISTNLTDGFFKQFALDNYKEIIKDIPFFDDMFFSKVDLAV